MGEWADDCGSDHAEHQHGIALLGRLDHRSRLALVSGSVASSDDAGSTAVLTFTGRSIGWVTHRDIDSGVAEVWIDGSLAATVSLHSTGATSLGRLVVFSKTWGVSSTHKIAIKVLGTAGHPKIDLDAFLILH
jgi:hypothetical protein